MGVKGPVLLSKNVMLPMSMLIDYMHLICLGVFKAILDSMLNTKYHNEEYYLGIKYKCKICQLLFLIISAIFFYSSSKKKHITRKNNSNKFSKINKPHKF